MDILNEYVGYLDRSYEQIKSSLIKRLAITNPEITDTSENNPLIIILSMFAGIAEMLNYHIDEKGREAFIETARDKNSILALLKQFDYRVKPAIAASVDITVEFLDGAGEVTSASAPFTIPMGTQFKNSNNIIFETVLAYEGKTGDSLINLKCKQFKTEDPYSLGISDGSTLQTYKLPSNYAHKTIQVNMGLNIWKEVDTLGFSLPGDLHFIVDVDEEGPYIKFGDGVFGAIPPSLSSITVNIKSTEGGLGNKISPKTITNIQTPFIVTGVDSFNAYNSYAPMGGTNIEGLEALRFRGPLSLRTLSRAVTYQDYLDIINLMPWVLKSKILETPLAPAFLTFYIVPIGGGIPSTLMLQESTDFMNERRVIGRNFVILPAGISKIHVNITAVGKLKANTNKAKNEIELAILQNNSYTSREINQPIRKSTFIAQAQNQPSIDYVEDCTIWLEPYIRPLNLNVGQLNYNIVIKPTSTMEIDWELIYNGPIINTFTLKKNGVIEGFIPTGDLYNNDTMALTINTGVYLEFDSWTFKTHPYNLDSINHEDYSLAVVELATLNINVTYTASTLALRTLLT